MAQGGTAEWCRAKVATIRIIGLTDLLRPVSVVIMCVASEAGLACSSQRIRPWHVSMAREAMLHSSESRHTYLLLRKLQMLQVERNQAGPFQRKKAS